MKQKKQAPKQQQIEWSGTWQEWCRSAHGITAIVIFIVAAVLLFSNIGGQCLWQDEAQTALVARTILTQGTPHGFDGRNFFSQESGAEYGNNYIWKWHTWLQFYVIAPFLMVLGSTSAAARLPFSIFGLATVILIYFLAAALWKSRRAGLYAAAGLALSVPFLIISRQCRYYSPSAFFTLLTIHAYLKLIDRKKYAWIYFAVAGTLLFQTFYVYCATLVAAIVVDALLFHRDRLKDVFLASAAVIVVNLPWIIWLSSMAYGSRYGGGHGLDKAWMFIQQIYQHIFTPWVLLLPLGAIAWRYIKDKALPAFDKDAAKKVALLVLTTAAMLTALAITSPWPFFRYLVPIIPFGVLLTALALDRVHPAFGIAAFALIVLWSPAQNLMTGKGDRNDIVTYLYEITHEFRGPVDGTVKYLKEHAKKTDVVLAVYEDLPLKYYTDLRVLGGLTGEDLTPASNADWIILRQFGVSDQQQKVFDLMNQLLKTGVYMPIEIDYPDTQFENREDPEGHMYQTETNAPKLIIYQRLERTGTVH